MDTLLGGVLRRIKPGDAERQRLLEISGRLISLIDRIAADAGIRAHGMLVGSAARGTWLSGECDLDIFICFPEHATRAELEEKGLAIARAAAAYAQESEERYAEHPYVHAVFDGYDVDLVPCFEVADAASIKSAVDRSPFHNRYVSEKIAGIEDEVLLLKQFLKGAGVYGSELKTRGFSGYLAELLVIRYGSFTDVLEDACGWAPGKVIDIEHHATAVQSDPLVVVDPTDPGRNVAAALSLENMCRFIDRACEFISSPGAEYFFPLPVQPMTGPELEALMAARGTSLLAIVFEPPDVVEDVLFPQLRKLEQSAIELLERNEFRVFASGVWVQDKVYIIFELEISELPPLKRHPGPYVWLREHAASFKSRYPDAYIYGGRYAADITREYTGARELLAARLTSCGAGRHVSQAIKGGYTMIGAGELARVEGMGRFLRDFFHRS